MGRLSEDGATRSFSSGASGYGRSEACVTFFLQRAQVAKRSYGTILGAFTLHHGMRDASFLDFSADDFKKFLKNVYTKIGLNPKDVSYYEAAGTASSTLDAKELNAAAEFYLAERENQLMIGSVKSNLGHTEGASSLVSLAKALVALNSGVIPPNLHYSSPNKAVPALLTGHLQVVTEPTSLQGDIVAVNDIGLSGGTMSHIVVRRNLKAKPPLHEGLLPPYMVPRLVLLSDRNERNLKKNLKRFEAMPVDDEYASLVNCLNKTGIKGHLLRAFTVWDGTKNSYNQVSTKPIIIFKVSVLELVEALALLTKLSQTCTAAQIIPDPKMRSSKWLSSSIPEDNWDSTLASRCSSEYLVNNLLSPVLFEEVSRKIPADAIMIEIAPHGLLQAIVRKSHSKAVHVPLTSRYDEDNLMFLLSAVGKIYANGLPVDIEKLYDPVDFPVSRGTPPLSNFFGWESAEFSKLEVNRRNDRMACWKDVKVDIVKEEKYRTLSNHRIRGMNILPQSFIVHKVVKHFTKLKNARDATIEIKNMKFSKEIQLDRGAFEMNIQLQKGTGSFCAVDGSDGSIIADGKLEIVDSKNFTDQEMINLEGDQFEIEGKEIFEFFESYGLSLENGFANLKKITFGKNGLKAILIWDGKFVEFLNGLFALISIFNSKSSNALQLVVSILRKIRIRNMVEKYIFTGSISSLLNENGSKNDDSGNGRIASSEKVGDSVRTLRYDFGGPLDNEPMAADNGSHAVVSRSGPAMLGLEQKEVNSGSAIEDSGPAIVNSRLAAFRSESEATNPGPEMIDSRAAAVDSCLGTMDSGSAIVGSGLAMVDSFQGAMDSGHGMVDSGPAILNSGLAAFRSGSGEMNSGPEMIDSGAAAVDSGPANVDSGLAAVQFRAEVMNSEPEMIDSGPEMMACGPALVDSCRGTMDLGIAIPPASADGACSKEISGTSAPAIQGWKAKADPGDLTRVDHPEIGNVGESKTAAADVNKLGIIENSGTTALGNAFPRIFEDSEPTVNASRGPECVRKLQTPFSKSSLEAHMIVNERRSDSIIWVEAVSWMLEMGARSVFALLRNCVLSRACGLRLQFLKHKFKNFKLTLLSDEALFDSCTLEHVGRCLDSIRPGTILFLSEGKNSTLAEALIQQLDFLRMDSGFICLGYGGELVCERRSRRGIRSLCVQMKSNDHETRKALEYLENLYEKSFEHPVVTIESPSSSLAKVEENAIANLPSSMLELQALLSTSADEPKFVEIPTKSPRRQFSKEIQPLYVFPGLKVLKLRQIVRKLFHPALEARYGKGKANIGREFSKLISASGQNMYTILAEGYGGILALQVASRLEMMGKIVRVVLVDSSPKRLQLEASAHLNDPESIAGPSFEMSSEVNWASRRVRGNSNPKTTSTPAMGRLSEDSVTRSFSADASGYARSEGCVALFLQRADHARRSYGTVDAIRSLFYGAKNEPFPQFSPDCYERLLRETYAASSVKPEDLAYVEAIGNASKVIDAQELNVVSKVLLPGRNRPLMVGSVKSNLGHTEGAASLVSLVKAILAVDRDVIPPNLHYSAPNPDVPSLLSGQLQVVSEMTPVEGDAIGVSSIGIAGPYTHVVVRKNPKDKKHRLAMGELPDDGLPRLVLLTGRHLQNVFNSKTRLSSLPIDPEHVHLMNNFARDGVRGHLSRGYTVLNGKQNAFFQAEEFGSGQGKRPVWYIFSGMGSQWPGMARHLMRLPVFAKAIQRCHDTLLCKGIDLIDAVTNTDPNIFDKILNAFVGIAATQIALVDVLRSVGVEPDGMVGHSLGEQGCGYADGCFTTEQMILSAYARGKASLDANLIKGTMAAVGMGYEQIRGELPEGVEIACHNSKESCTLSGPSEDVAAYIEKLKARGVFARLVNVGNIAFHSKHMKPAGKLLLEMLGEVIPQPKKRTSRWISSSNPESKWDTELAQYCSAEYHTNNMLSSVLFQEATAHIPEEAIVIEIAPHALLQAITKRSLPKATHVPLTNRNEEDSLSFLFAALGKLYANGIPIEANNLYPPIELPVSRGTPTLSPYIGWDHRVSFRFVRKRNEITAFWTELNVNLADEEFQSLNNHKTNGNVVLADSFYIDRLIDMYTNFKSVTNPVVFIQNLKFEDTCKVDLKSKAKLRFKVQKGLGEFCVTEDEGGKLFASGIISLLDTKTVDTNDYTVALRSDYDYEVEGTTLLALFKYLGLELNGDYANIRKLYAHKTSIQVEIRFTNSLTEFLNSVFLLAGFYKTRGFSELMTMKAAHEIVIDPLALLKCYNKDVVVEYDSKANTVTCTGLKISMPLTKAPNMGMIQDVQGRLSREVPAFVPYILPKVTSPTLILEICVQIILENTPHGWNDTIKVFNIGEPLRNDLRALLRSPQYGDRIELTCYDSEEDLVERDMTTIHTDIVWVVSSSGLKPSTGKALESSLKCYILSPNEAAADPQLFEELSTFQLSESILSLTIVKNSDDDKKYELVTYTPSNLTALQDKLAIANELNKKENTDRHCVVLMGVVDSASSLIHIVDETSQLSHLHLLKYLFADEPLQGLISSKIPIQKDLKWNLKLGGKWGSLRMLPADWNDDLAMDDVYTGTQVYPLASVVPSKDVTSLGLNLMDVTGSETNSVLKVFDYVSAKSMGIGVYDPVSGKFSKDDLLMWDRPKSWSNSEAASVPLLYALASYIIHLKNNNCGPGKSVLINRGLLPLSQALITLALDEYEQVFVTVYGEEEKNDILRIFPGLKKENILDCQTSTFHVDLLRKTNGKGVYKVVNTFAEDMMILPCQKCTAPLGIMVQVSSTPISHNSRMGMLFFDKEIVAEGATVELLINSSAESKILIRDKVQKAIDNGRIKFLNNLLLLPPNSTNSDAANHMKLVKSKVVVDLKENANGNSTPKMFHCDPQLNYIIVGGQQQSDFWLRLTEWLLRRGARKINVVLRESAVSPALALRQKSLMDMYPTARIHLSSTQQIDSKENIENFLTDVEHSAPLSSIILLGSAVKDSAVAIDSVLKEKRSKCDIICIGKGGERLVERRRKEGQKTVCIRGCSSLLETNGFLQCFDDIIVNSKTNSIVTLNRFLLRQNNQSLEKPGQEWNHVPTSLPELHQLLRLSSRAAIFSEVATPTVRWEMNREVDPVFVIPGLRPNRVRMIAKQLQFPMLIAKLPNGPLDIGYAASNLAQEMAALPQNLFTIIADDWGGILGLNIAAKLQQLGRLSTVILLGGNPAWIMRYASKLTDDDLKLVQKYLRIPQKMVLQLKKCKSWEAQMKLISENSENKEAADQTLQSIALVKNRLQSVLTVKRPSRKIRTLCHLFTTADSSSEDESIFSEPILKSLQPIYKRPSPNLAVFSILVASTLPEFLSSH
ncbi:unnamed protein product [Nesidiocoris tenuis]|uniref:Ketosynthase family 3 (KS3) domain-containing protein n=1 Tax=Nesidiocoris tenuis TaxID=355587 RepID=A0A6H5HW16_9HEMI|nr:unnamed protein product [Nesidiocoris tenuis]